MREREDEGQGVRGERERVWGERWKREERERREMLCIGSLC